MSHRPAIGAEGNRPLFSPQVRKAAFEFHRATRPRALRYVSLRTAYVRYRILSSGGGLEVVGDADLRSRMGEAAAATARARFDLEANIGRIEEIYASLVEGNST